MDWLNGVLGRASALHRGKDARISRDCRENAARALRSGQIKEALALASQAVLRAPLTGKLNVVLIVLLIFETSKVFKHVSCKYLYVRNLNYIPIQANDDDDVL